MLIKIGLHRYYALMQDVVNNATLKAAAELHDPQNTSLLCGGGGVMSFDNDVYTSYWANVVGGEIGSEPGVNAVFFDGYDKLYSSNTLATSYKCPGFTSNATANALRDKVAATARLTDVLNAHNTTPILSTYNYLAAASEVKSNHVKSSQSNSPLSGPSGASASLEDSGGVNRVKKNSHSDNMNGVYEDECKRAQGE